MLKGIKKIVYFILRLIDIIRELFIKVFGCLFVTYKYLKIIKRRHTGEPRLVWGSDPIISNKYWSQALREAGFESHTMMSCYYGLINKQQDFDLYFDEILKKYQRNYVSKRFSELFRPYLLFLYAIEHFDIFHIPLHGFVLNTTWLKFKEAQLLKFAGKKVIALPYGGDFYRYSKVEDPSLRHALLKSYPQPGRLENPIDLQVKYWVEHADVFLPMFQIDGIGRWDVLPFSAVAIDERMWEAKNYYSLNDGVNGAVKIIHTPNHRGFKGTEFIIKAIEELKSEGLLIDFTLVEKVSNDRVRQLMYESDILVEQLIATCYALSGIEGMATGIPVLSNLDSEFYTRVFRRYSYLNECPILSTTPESVKENLKLLIKNPELRKELGMAGRNYVVKYHSYNAATFLFKNIYDKIWFKKDVQLLNLYDPNDLNSYNRLSECIHHPLVENKWLHP